MPTQSVSFDMGVLAAAGQEAAIEYRDGLAKACNLLRAQEEANGKPKWHGGQLYLTTSNMQDHTGITQFVDGFELFDPTANETQRNPSYPLCVSGLLMKIGVTERYLYGATNGAMKKKVRFLTQSCMGFLQRRWSQRILAATGAGFSNWITLNGIDSTAGVFEENAVGSQTNTIGGLSKTTYSSVIGWQNCVSNLNNAFGTNQIGLYNLLEQTKKHKEVNPKKKRWFMTVQGMTNIKRVVQGHQYFTSTDPKSLDYGTVVDLYQGIRIHQEQFLPIDGASTTTYPMTALLLDLEDIFWAWGQAQNGEGGALPDGYFGTGTWEKLGGLQMVIGCPMMVVGNTIVTDMGSSGIAYAGETY